VSVWEEVEVALDNIIDDYEKVNHLISLFQDDKTRVKGLSMVHPSIGSALELGSGPGNFSRMIHNEHEGPLICLDFSYSMLSTARRKNEDLDLFYVRGVFEALPFKKEAFNLITASYALRDTLNICKALVETHNTLKNGGKLLIIDIGKPDNRLIRGFMRLFVKYWVPIIGGIATGHGYSNPWSILYQTFDRLPSNKRLSELLNKFFVNVNKEEFIFGALILLKGTKINYG